MTELELFLTTVERMRAILGDDDSTMDWMRNRYCDFPSPLDMVGNGKTRLLYQAVLWNTEEMGH